MLRSLCLSMAGHLGVLALGLLLLTTRERRPTPDPLPLEIEIAGPTGAPSHRGSPGKSSLSRLGLQYSVPVPESVSVNESVPESDTVSDAGTVTDTGTDAYESARTMGWGTEN